MAPGHDWHRDMEPLPIKAAGVASFLRSCKRPRAAAWALSLGEELERARKEIFELRTQVGKLSGQLAELRGVKWEPHIPHSNKSELE